MPMAPGIEGLYMFPSAFWKKFMAISDEDLVDRLNRVYTMVLLLMFAIFSLSYGMLYGPIECWMRGETQGQMSYAKDVCWVCFSGVLIDTQGLGLHKHFFLSRDSNRDANKQPYAHTSGTLPVSHRDASTHTLAA